MRAYLFDLDGTLLDSIDLILTSFHHTLRVHRDQQLPDSYWLKGIGTPLRDQLGTIAESPEELSGMLETYIEFNLANHDSLAKPYPGVVEVVRELERRGARLALVTSKLSRGAQHGLRLLGLEDEFSVRVCADDVVHGKPHPEPVLKALEALGVEPSEAVFIGDSAHDIDAGRLAGVTTAAVSWGPFPRQLLDTAEPDHWFDEPRQILDL